MAERNDRIHESDQQPITEPLQADPYLTEGPVRPWAKWAVAVAIAVVVCIVIYGLNARGPEPQAGGTVRHSTSSPAPASNATTGSGAK